MITTTTRAEGALTAIHCRHCDRVLLLLAPGVFRRPVTLTCPDCGRERVLPRLAPCDQELVARMCYTESAPM